MLTEPKFSVIIFFANVCSLSLLDSKLLYPYAKGHALEMIIAATMMIKNTGGTIFLVLYANLPMKDISGIRLLCWVLMMAGPNTMSRPGITTNTDSIARRIALIRQIAISGPSLNCMHAIAAIPPTVVSELPNTSGTAWERASTTDSRRGRRLFSSLNLLIRITA